MKTAMIQVRVTDEEKRAYEKALALDHSKSLGEFLRRAATDRLRILMGKDPLPIERTSKEFLEMVEKAPRVKADSETIAIIAAAEERLRKGTMKTISADEALKKAKKLAGER